MVHLLSWNVNGIRAVANKGFLTWMEKAQPDILGLQEIKAKKDQVPEEIKSFDNYHTYWNPAERPGYSGTALLTKIKPKKVTFGFGEPQFDCEGRVIEADFGDFVFFNIYFPNGGDGNKRVPYKLEFYDHLLKHCQELRKRGKRVVIAGDYNTAHTEIDLKNPKANEKNTGFLPEERAWIDRYIEAGYIDTFREFCKEPHQYSYWSMRTAARKRNAGWRLDYHFICEELRKNLKDAYILKDVMGSDHCPVGVELRF